MRGECSKQQAVRPRGRRRLLRGFIKNRDGVTVIEFGLLAMPFCLLIFAIFETCISFAAEAYMQNITHDFAREFRTGNIRPATYTQQQFREVFCKRLQGFVGEGCPGLDIDLRHFTTFAEAAALRTYKTEDKEIEIDGGFQYDPGPTQSLNVLRVFYRWPVITDLLSRQMATLKDGKTLHFATATWQNEPFNDE